MKICYLILAHKNPEQVLRLVSRLVTSESYFFIHIDKSVSDTPFKYVLKGINHVYFLECDSRSDGVWGGFGIVQASINLMRYALSQVPNGYIILLSGQDYPLRSGQRIQSFFEQSSLDAYVFAESIPTSFWNMGGLDRLNLYRLNLSADRFDFVMLPSILEKSFHSKRVLQKVYAILRRGKKKTLFKILRKRRHPNDIKPFGGSQWWAMSSNLARQILNFIDDHPAFLKYHQDTLLADEIFIQTIIHHIIKNNNILKIAPSLTYTNWERKHVPLPVTFEHSDFEELKEASKTHLFARKFDIDRDTKILDRIDTELLS